MLEPVVSEVLVFTQIPVWLESSLWVSVGRSSTIEGSSARTGSTLQESGFNLLDERGRK